MNRNAVICGIEYALRDEGCNEMPLGWLYSQVKETRGNFDVSFNDLVAIVRELVNDGLFEVFGEDSDLSENSLVARSQTHPSVPYGGPIHLGDGKTKP